MLEKIKHDAFKDELEKIAKLSEAVGAPEHVLNAMFGGYPGFIQHSIEAKKGKKLNAALATIGREAGYGAVGGVAGMAIKNLGYKAIKGMKSGKAKSTLRLLSALSPYIGANIGGGVGYQRARTVLHKRDVFKD